MTKYKISAKILKVEKSSGESYKFIFQKEELGFAYFAVTGDSAFFELTLRTFPDRNYVKVNQIDLRIYENKTITIIIND